MNGARNGNFFSPPLEALGRGQISFNFNYRVNFKDFYTKLCVWSPKYRIQIISDGILIPLPGSCPGGGGGGAKGKGAKIRNRYNLVPHLTQDTNEKVTNSQ